MFRIPVSWVGIEVERVLEPEENSLVIEAVSTAETAVCPGCGESSRHIHSYYSRSPQDLPISGYRVCLHLINAICPGWVATDMGGTGGRPVAKGAVGIVWAATLPHGGPTGGFFRDEKPLPW